MNEMKISLRLMICLLLAISFLFIGCGDDSDDGNGSNGNGYENSIDDMYEKYGCEEDGLDECDELSCYLIDYFDSEFSQYETLDEVDSYLEDLVDCLDNYLSCLDSSCSNEGSISEEAVDACAMPYESCSNRVIQAMYDEFL